MNRNYNILSGALLLLVSGTCFQSCQQDDFGDLQPDIETLVAEGRYLTARSVDASELASDTEEPRLFAVGTPYRLLAFTKKYDGTNPSDNTLAEKPRFNKVAWEGETSTGMRFINIDSDPDKWFGFSALDGETGGDDNLVSLDFYGFTYGKEAEHPLNYIELDGIIGQGVPTAGSFETLSHTETLLKTEDSNTELSDLMRGMLLNQNIQTAGKSDDGKTNNAYTQSVMPFKHCFSKLRFQISQQGDEDKKDADGNPTPSFENLYVEKIEVTNTYDTGKVFLHNGKVKLFGQPCDRNLPFKSGFSGQVTTKNTDVGDMIVFPSDGDALTNMADGYDVGLSITVKSAEEKDIKNMLVNTGSVDANGKAVIKETTDEVGTTWYSGTIKKDKIIDYYDLTSIDTPLYFKQNTSYMLIITFQKDAVRIITVIPQVEEWLPGEGDEKGPWQEQALGQPQMFNNILWSDRNLGADDYDPLGENFEKTVGYFYQAGRNIPYYPFNPNDKENGTIKEDGTPYFNKKNDQKLPKADTSWGNNGDSGSPFKFYPIVDGSIINMEPKSWIMDKKSIPQMVIPESKPTTAYFNFLRSIWEEGKEKAFNGLSDEQNEHWEIVSNQPVSGGWVIPSSLDFLSVFPSTPHAGNITMKRGGNNNTPMDWGSNDEQNKKTLQTKSEILRVTVPYYTPEMAKPTGKNSQYLDAWNILKDNNDPGTTHCDEYVNGGPNVNEPDGDPSDGYASAYVISRAEGHKYSLSGYVDDESNFSITEWGTIYAIKNIYTSKAYRIRWRACIARQATELTKNPCIYIEVCRYRCNASDKLTEENYASYDWEHPAARIYFPICGLGDYTGQFINFGIECQYATSDKIVNSKTSAVQIKITGNNGANAYIAVVKNVINRNFGMQIRPIGGGK